MHTPKPRHRAARERRLDEADFGVWLAYSLNTYTYLAHEEVGKVLHRPNDTVACKAQT